MPAVPFIIQGGLAAGSAIAGHYASRAAASGAMQRSPEEQAALARIGGMVGPAGANAQQLTSLSTPAVGQTLNYYGTLLGGNRAAIRQAVAPEIQDITDAYKGANAAVTRGYLQGGEREQAIAENARARAGQISKLISGVRPMAATGAGQVGLGAAQAGNQGLYTAGLLNQALLQQGFQNRLVGLQAGQQAANQWGGLFARLSNALGPVGAKKPTTTTGTTSGTGPPLPAWEPSTPSRPEDVLPTRGPVSPWMLPGYAGSNPWQGSMVFP